MALCMSNTAALHAWIRSFKASLWALRDFPICFDWVIEVHSWLSLSFSLILSHFSLILSHDSPINSHSLLVLLHAHGQHIIDQLQVHELLDRRGCRNVQLLALLRGCGKRAALVVGQVVGEGLLVDISGLLVT